MLDSGIFLLKDSLLAKLWFHSRSGKFSCFLPKRMIKVDSPVLKGLTVDN